MLFLVMCVHLVLCMSSAGVHGDQKHWMPLKVELRVAVRHLMWVVGTELSPLEEQRSLLSSEPFPHLCYSRFQQQGVRV